MEPIQRVLYIMLFGASLSLFSLSFHTNSNHNKRLPASESNTGPTSIINHEGFLITLGISNSAKSKVIQAENDLLKVITQSIIDLPEESHYEMDPVYLAKAKQIYQKTLADNLSKKQIREYQKFLRRTSNVIHIKGASYSRSMLSSWIQ